jgi:hypothetical protein
LALFSLAWIIISFVAIAATKKRYSDPVKGLGRAEAPSNASIMHDTRAEYDRTLLMLIVLSGLCLFVIPAYGFLIRV